MINKVQPIIQIENLTRKFGSVLAVDRLSISVPGGIIFGFLGPNGAGKTTTIRMLLGLMKPTSGKASILGYDLATQSDLIRSRTGALLEHAGVYEHLSAEDNLEFYGRVNRLSKQDRKTRIKSLLQQMNLWNRRKERVGKWSRGMKQRLALARTLLHRPPLVFLDEPTAGLDVIAAKEVRNDLANLVANEGTTVFLTTHNMAEAEELCSRVAVVRNGRTLAVDEPGALKARASIPGLRIIGTGFTTEALAKLNNMPVVLKAEADNGFLNVQLSDDASVPEILNLLVFEGALIKDIQHDKASLEEVFIKLMDEEIIQESKDEIGYCYNDVEGKQDALSERGTALTHAGDDPPTGSIKFCISD